MKFSKFLLSAACALSLGSLASCQSEDTEPELAPGTFGKNEVIVPLTMKLPDDFRTRAAAGGSVGSDGLYTFSRDIDKVWYAVYYDNKLMYHSEENNLIEQCKKNGNSFTLLMKIHKDYDPSKVYLFFWAGNKQDNVKVNTANANGINLNFADRSVTVDPKYMNGNGTLAEYDSFAGYFQLSTTPTVSTYKKTFTLKRPFCQIHILTDSMLQPMVGSAYPSGFTCVPGFGRNAATASNYNSELVSPTTWYFDGSLASNPVMRQNEYNYTLTNYEFTNRLTKQTPERVTFNGRLMDYMGCYYVFAPPVKQPLKGAVSSGNPANYSKLNLALRKVGQTLGQSEFIPVPLPSEGIKANERYVLIVHGGGNGPVPYPWYNFEFNISNNSGWDGTVNSEV